PKKPGSNCLPSRPSKRFTKWPPRTATKIWIMPPPLLCWKNGRECRSPERPPSAPFHHDTSRQHARTPARYCSNLLCNPVLHKYYSCLFRSPDTVRRVND